MRRFYTSAQATQNNQGWYVALDGRSVKTPGKHPLFVPTQALAHAIAEEWQAQGDRIDPDTMPLTQYSCSALDRVAGARAYLIAQISAYVATDLLAYPTDQPAALRDVQDAHWHPLIDRMAALGWPLIQTSGLMAVDQDPSLAPRAQAWLDSKALFPFTALANLIETSGSFFLAYLHAEDGLEIERLIQACTLEEQFNLKKWGSDEEAEQLLGRRIADLKSAAQMLALL